MATNRDQWQVPALLAIALGAGICYASLTGIGVWPPRLAAVMQWLFGGAGSRRAEPESSPRTAPRTPISIAGDREDGDTHRPDDHAALPVTADSDRGESRDEREAAIDRSLNWLVRHQRNDGSWSFDLRQCADCGGRCDGSGLYPDAYGATALAVLPFLGRGYTHVKGPYREQLRRAISLLSRRSSDVRAGKSAGQIYTSPDHGMYVQGFATRALAECYAASRDEGLREPTQLAVRFIENARGERGGWRYTPRENEADVVSTGCQVLALHVAKQAGLVVSEPGLRIVGGFLDTATSNGGARYAYIGGNQQDRDGPTAVALLSRICLGWNRGHPALQRGIDGLATIGPTRDLYFDYHATQIMRHCGGDRWIAWFPRIKDLLLARQARRGHATGSWHEGFEHGESSQAGGRLFCTVMSALILETYERPVISRRERPITYDDARRE